MSHITHTADLHMGWLQWVGSFKLYVSFAQYRLFYRALLQKRPMILRNLLIVVTPYLLRQAWMSDSCHIYEWIMSHTWMNHVTRINESCHTYERVMSQTWMRQVTHINESCHTHDWFTYLWAQSWMSESVSVINESCHTHTNESCHT